MPRVITAALLADAFTGFKTSFRNGFKGVSPVWGQVATLVPSTTLTEKYTWLGSWPGIREWLGDRQVKELASHDYSITNKDYESTVKVPRNSFEDDQLGIFTPMFDEMGRAVASFPDRLVFALLAAGFVNKCYDGQPFFDDEHPVAGGLRTNMQDGAGTPWFLLDTSRALKPLIYQRRRDFDMVALDDPKDPNVFYRKEYVYGVDGRANAGYGFWQMAYASKGDLDAANYELARKTMAGHRDDEGNPLGVRGDLLVVPGSLEGPARRLLERSQVAGSDNEWAGTAKLLVVDWL